MIKMKMVMNTMIMMIIIPRFVVITTVTVPVLEMVSPPHSVSLMVMMMSVAVMVS